MKKKSFLIPGMYHPIILNLVSSSELDSDSSEETTMGNYFHFECTINLSNDLAPEVKKHTLYHELSHHILDTLEEINNEEDRCNLLATYLINLSQSKDYIDGCLK